MDDVGREEGDGGVADEAEVAGVLRLDAADLDRVDVCGRDGKESAKALLQRERMSETRTHRPRCAKRRWPGRCRP